MTRHLLPVFAVLGLALAPVPSPAAAAESDSGSSSSPAGLERIYGSIADLEAAVERYQKIVDAGGWPAIDSGPVIEPGESDPRPRRVSG